MTVDLILYGGKIYTMNPAQPICEALAIQGGRIVACGTDADIRRNFQAKTSILLSGKVAYPGFIDPHCHLIRYGKSRFEADLTGCSSFEEVLHRLQPFSQAHPEGWLVGRGWDHNHWPGKQYPTRELLDTLFPDRPVFLQRIDIHAALVNSHALQLAGIDSTTRIEGGEIICEGTQPTGLLIDKAQEPVLACMPNDDENALQQYLLAAQRDCLAVGLCSLGDAWLPQTEIDAIRSLHQSGDLHLRIYGMMPADSRHLDQYLSAGPVRDEWLHLAAFKLFADGALGSRGAWLLEAYSDAPETRGLALLDPEKTERIARKIYQAGFQLNTHAIGDAANRYVLDLYASIVAPLADHRWRVEHAQLVHPDDFHKFGQHGIIPSVQPTHATSDMNWVGQRVGPERLSYSYPHQQFLRELPHVPIGSDFPVESVDPLKSFYAAVTRCKPGEKTPFFPEQAISRYEALKGITLSAAYAQHEEAEKGSLEVGKMADITVLDTDLLTIEVPKISAAQTYFTIVAGRVVYSR